MNQVVFHMIGNFFDSESRNLPTAKIKNLSELKRSLRITRQYNVVLLDDNDHTYEYVIEMLVEIFGHSKARAFEMACTVDLMGRVVVFTSTKKSAEEKRIQILSYGPDWRLSRSNGSMKAIIEPAE
ncbi:MAG TPA: ATP-dependent Clp protease adaptor ClpS [Thermodesulfobacteriota bacterium]